MKSLNLGILAHVDAGKTSLTERLLYTAGVIGKIGSVDQGTTQTDTLALERKRGITIKSAVVSFSINDVTINLIDTPGHPDFIAEVERVLHVLDGVVLVISAVEGVQPQTRILMRTLQRLHIPVLLFVNKIDRTGARYAELLEEITGKLHPGTFPMESVEELGTRNAYIVPINVAGGNYAIGTLDVLAEHDESLLAARINGEPVSALRLNKALIEQTKQALIYPMFFGSAITGAGVDYLLQAIPKYLPVTAADLAGQVAGHVFKVERDKYGEKLAYVSLTAGTIRKRDVLKYADNKLGKVVSVQVFERGGVFERPQIVAGSIGKVKGLNNIQIGDHIGMAREDSAKPAFPRPTLESVIEPRHTADKAKLRNALDQLAEQDPLINVRQLGINNELLVSLYGEVQKEVIQATLADEYGIETEFHTTKPICIERPAGTGAAVQLLQEESNPTSATIGLRIEPAPNGSGITFKLAVDPQFIPVYIYKNPGSFVEHMRRYVEDALQEGLHGWNVTDCLVTMTVCNYYTGDGPAKPISDTPRTTANDFRTLTPLVLKDALNQAGTVVCEPICHFELTIPADTQGPVLAALTKLDAFAESFEPLNSTIVVNGSIPAGKIHVLQQQLPSLTSGEGLFEYAFHSYS